MRTLLGLDPGHSAVRVKLSLTFGHLIELEDADMRTLFNIGLDTYEDFVRARPWWPQCCTCVASLLQFELCIWLHYQTPLPQYSCNLLHLLHWLHLLHYQTPLPQFSTICYITLLHCMSNLLDSPVTCWSFTYWVLHLLHFNLLATLCSSVGYINIVK